MRPNVFLLDLSVGEEDLLTAYWHYVLSVVPDLGQAFVDHIAERAGMPSSRFLGAIDHPIGDRSNHPDLLLRCSEYDLLFEHKLDSPLGPEQLERYVALAMQKGWKMALLAARRLEVADGVCQSPAFVCPRGVGVPPHFLWQDVHEVLARSEAHLAHEFREYLEALGLGRFDWAARQPIHR
jgi:hypothetical protein